MQNLVLDQRESMWEFCCDLFNQMVEHPLGTRWLASASHVLVFLYEMLTLVPSPQMADPIVARKQAFR